MTSTMKTEAHRIVDQLPNDATWDDLMDQIYVRIMVDPGIEESRRGEFVSTEEVRREFGLHP